MRAALRLEDFAAADRGQDPVREAAIARARSEARAEGYAAGLAAGLAQGDGEERAAIAALVESAQDLQLSSLAARAEGAAMLRPLVEALARVAAPYAAAKAFPAVLAEAVAARTAAAPDARIVAYAPPALTASIAERFGDGVEVREDPALTGAQARLEWIDGGAELDVEGCLTAARDAVDRFFGETEGRAQNVE